MALYNNNTTVDTSVDPELRGIPQTGTAIDTTQPVSQKVYIDKTYVDNNTEIINDPGGNRYEVQFNYGSSFKGDSGFTYDPVTKLVTIRGNINLGGYVKGKIVTNFNNFKLAGGTNGQVLATDGLGNLSWVNQTGGSGGGNGNSWSSWAVTGQNTLTADGEQTIRLVSGTNMSITTNTSNNSIRFDAIYSNTNVENFISTYGGHLTGGNVVITGTGHFYNINAAGNANIETLNVNTQSRLGSVSNVKITGGSANYVLRTDGTGNLSWVAPQSGPTGPQGPQGNPGTAGTAATITLGTITTGNAGSNVLITNTGNSSAAVFNFTIPKGDRGLQGDQGPQGAPGAAGATGPKGDKGDTGAQGIPGSTGAQGAPGAKGDKGDTGEQGVSVTLIGSVPTPADLPTPGGIGEGYIVSQTGNLWFWNSLTTSWNDIGQIVGPQGDPGPTGATGSTGPQGDQGPQGDPGPAGADGADALWNFRGAYDNVASYAIGDVVTYGGETWYRIDANFGEGSDIPVEGTFWTKIAQKGADGTAGSGITGWTVSTGNHLLPNTDNLQDIGSSGSRIRHIYVGPGSVTIGDSVITESTTGKLVLPGVTRATTLFAEEVEDTADQIYVFGGIPFVTDAYDYSIRSGLVVAPGGYVKAEYLVDQIDNDGYIDGITVDVPGTWTQAIADINKRNSMYAYVGPDINEPFDVSNWIQIPFIVSPKADDVEYEFNTGGGTDLGSFTIDGDELSADQMTLKTNEGSIHIASDTHVYVQTDGGGKQWSFANDGILTLPQDGDIVDSNGSSVLGGGGGNPFDQDLNKDDNVEFGRVTIPYYGYVGVLDDTFSIVDNSDGAVVIASASDSHRWTFETGGALRLPEGGDIINSDGQSVLGGGGGSIDRLVNGDYQVVLDSDGKLTAPDDIIVGQNGRFVKDCNNSSGTTSMRWINVPINNNNIELIRVYSSDEERAQIKLNWLDEDRSGLTIRAFDLTDSGDTVEHDWKFQGNGGLVFPDATVQTTAFTGLPDLITASVEAPDTGIFWFNTEEARIYVKYNEQWVDASPTVLAPPDTNPILESVTFNDNTTQTTAWTGSVSYNDLTDKPVTPTFVGGGGAATWLTAD